MNLKRRIKKVREILGKTQKEMASYLGISPRTWQNYEEGIHEPSWKVLDGLASLGIDANWLLTGIGEVRQGYWNNMGAPGIGERIKIVRDKTDQSIFAHRLGIEKETLEAYEKEQRSPDVNFMSMLCQDFTINPAWLLLGKIPKTADIIYKDEEYEVIAKLDVAILRDVLLSIKESFLDLMDEGLCDESSIVDIENHAELIASLYEDSIEHESTNKPLKYKTAKIKRLFAIAKELKRKE